MALYPDTSCFYRAQVIEVVSGHDPIRRVSISPLVMILRDVSCSSSPLHLNMHTGSSLRMMMTKYTKSLRSGLWSGQAHSGHWSATQMSFYSLLVVHASCLLGLD